MIVHDDRQIPTDSDLVQGPPAQSCPACLRWRVVKFKAASTAGQSDNVCAGCWQECSVCECPPLAAAA